MKAWRFVSAALAAALLLAPIYPNAQEAVTRSAPTYTSAQAAQGRTAYTQSCASCHGGNLDDGPLAPPLKGVAFVQKYGGRSVDELFVKTSTTMPPTQPGIAGRSHLRADRRLHPAGQRRRRRAGGAAVG